MRLSFSLIFFLVIISISSTAQTVRIDESELIGVWQYGTYINTLDTAVTSYNKFSISEYTFLASGAFEFKYFRITQTHYDTCLQSVTQGKWKIKNNEVTLTYDGAERRFLRIGNKRKYEWSSEQLVKFNRDSIIVYREGFYGVEGNLNEATSSNYYKRLNAATTVTENGKDSCNNFYKLPATALNLQSITFNDNYKYLINSFDSTIVVRIPEDRNIDIYFEEQLTDSIYAYKSLAGIGYVDSIYDDSIIVSLYEMHVNLYNQYPYDGLNTSLTNYGEETPYFITPIDLYNLPEIGFTTNASDVLQSLSAFGMASGTFTALILAPLLSINYSSGEFRGQRYYRIAGYSLMATAISIPIYWLSMPKRYTIIPKSGDMDKNHWYLSY